MYTHVYKFSCEQYTYLTRISRPRSLPHLVFYLQYIIHSIMTGRCFLDAKKFRWKFRRNFSTSFRFNLRHLISGQDKLKTVPRDKIIEFIHRLQAIKRATVPNQTLLARQSYNIANTWRWREVWLVLPVKDMLAKEC